MSLALAFATIERAPVAQRLVRSIRQHFPDLPVYVADQSRQIGPMRSFYETHGGVPMPFDAGVAASRNRVVASIAEEFFVLCDDDFILNAQTSFDAAMAILTAHPDIGVVGGRLRDTSNGVPYDRHWEMYLQYDPANRLLTSIPMYHFAPQAHRLGEIEYFICDTALNFAVFRRSLFTRGIGWDERFKSNGEHEDFYLSLKLNGQHRVAYLPSMVAAHDHIYAFANYRTGLRERPEGWQWLMQKWQVDQYLEVGFGVRTIDQPGEVVRDEAARDRYHIAPTEALSADASGLPRPPCSEKGLRGAALFFRYDPVLKSDSDFLLWYRAEQPSPPAITADATVWLRWFAPDGGVLVWESAHSTLDLEQDHWQALLVDVPLFAAGAAWLRFEVIADDHPAPAPVATGFVFANPQATPGQEAESHDVLALSRMHDPSPGSAAARPNGDGATTATDLGLALAVSSPELETVPLCLLRTDGAPRLNTLLFTGWSILGYTRYVARMPEDRADAPTAIALPRTACGANMPIVAIDAAGNAVECLGHSGKASRALSGDLREGVTVVVTSCGRQDLLEQTLESFFKFNSYPIERFVVVEDGVSDKNAALMQKFRGRGITWIGTQRRTGQIAAIDRAYTLVGTDMIFHMGDDWEFYAPGFIEKSRAVLAADPACLGVMLQALDDTNGHPLLPDVETVGGIATRKYSFDYRGICHGFSFNPGLRRTADYRRLGSYGLHVTFEWRDRRAAEASLSRIYRDLGMHARILADNEGGGYLRHIGWGRTVSAPVDNNYPAGYCAA